MASSIGLELNIEHEVDGNGPAASSPAGDGEMSDAEAELAVRLPATDLRRPLAKGAKTFDVPGVTDQAPDPDKQSSSSSASNHSYFKSTSLSAPPDQDVKKFSRALFPRSSRGCGESHNKGIKAARQRFLQEKAAEQRRAHKAPAASEHGIQASNMALTSSSLTNNHLGLSRSSSSTSSTSQLSTSHSVGSHPVVRLPQKSSAPFRQVLQGCSANGVYGPTSSNGRPNSVFHRTGPHQVPNRQSYQNKANGFNFRSRNEFATWTELGVKIFDLPAGITTLDLWKCFSQEGTIVSIELYEDTKGVRDGKACIRFSPPPAKRFWECSSYPVHVDGQGTTRIHLLLEHRRRSFLHPSPVDPNFEYPELMTMQADSLDFGIMLNPATMMNMYTALPTLKSKIQFRQSMLHREITVEFHIYIRDPRVPYGNTRVPQLGKYNRTELFRFRIPFSQLKVIRKMESQEGKLFLLISMESPPKFFKELEATTTHDDNGRFWSRGDTWYRQTDIVYAPNTIRKSALTLKKTKPIIDIGRWTTYRFVFETSENDAQVFNLMCRALSDYNVEVIPFPNLKVVTQSAPAVWEYLDKSVLTEKNSDADVKELKEGESLLSFQVRYQLEVCISHGYLNEHNLTPTFVDKLLRMKSGHAQDLLEYVANQGNRVFDPLSLFNLEIAESSALRAKVPHYCTYTRSATITPTTVYFHTPTVETSNRVIREFHTDADRFLRVRFADEKSEGKIYSTHKETMNEVFTRIKRTMTNGITIGNRHYQFLAFGNSQFREHGAYFFAPTASLDCQKIRKWMGMFEDIKVVAKYASRLGQCFSTTRAISGTTTILVETQDIKRNGYNFTDGVGRISPFLAHFTASALGISRPSHPPPSVFQFRMGGCKGVLAVSPGSGSLEIHIRKSQYKFPAMHEGLEIIRCSQFASASLNRQLILVLSALGVPDRIFIEKLKTQLSNLEQAMTDEKMALSILQKDVDANQMTLAVAAMILEGFQKTGEPFVTSLLQLWRAWTIKYLKEKARITIPNGALLLGCVDETATLKGHYEDSRKLDIAASVKEKSKLVPEVFVQLSKGPDEKPQIIKGPMLLARNPSLHPGDIRVVCGVDLPVLHHLKDVVVLPQTGDRDVASMCSGGDLDGDDFLVMWDQGLLPREWNHEPMDYSAPEPVEHTGPITVDDLTTFFVTYMKNDTLSRIAHAHVANADYYEKGVKDEKCLKLAALHSMAVDFVKTGQPAQMTRELVPRKWPHFMEKKYKPKEQIYTSHKVLGQLYDQVERVDFVPAFSAPFDNRILEAYSLGEGILESAHQIKQEYDAHMRRIMAQHEIKTEFEVWSTFVLQHANINNDYKFHEQIGQLSTALKETFRSLCYERAGGRDFEQIGPFAAAMYEVTSREMTEAVKECNEIQVVGGLQKWKRQMTPSAMPLMSFPWLFQDVLGRIAKTHTRFAMKEWRELVCETEPSASGSLFVSKSPTHYKKRHTIPNLSNTGDDLVTAEGVTHRGEVLELFEKSDKLIDFEEKDEQQALPSGTMSVNSSCSSAGTSMAAGSSFDDLMFGENTPESPELAASKPRAHSSISDLDPDVLVNPASPGKEQNLSESYISSEMSSIIDGFETARSGRAMGHIPFDKMGMEAANQEQVVVQDHGFYKGEEDNGDKTMNVKHRADIHYGRDLQSSQDAAVGTLEKREEGDSSKSDISDAESDEVIIRINKKLPLFDQLTKVNAGDRAANAHQEQRATRTEPMAHLPVPETRPKETTLN